MRRRAILSGPLGSDEGTSAGQLKIEFGFERFPTELWLRQVVANGSVVDRPAGLFLECGERGPGEPAQTLAGVRR